MEIVTKIAPIALALIMLGLGLGLKVEDFTYPITKQLILDGRKNKILNKKINLKIKIILFHGIKDDVVPISYSRNILNIFRKSKGKLIKIKNGDHSLSKKNDLKKICAGLSNIIKRVNFD